MRNSARGSQLQAFAFILLEHRASKININTLKEKDITTLALPSAAPPNTATIRTYRAGGFGRAITRSTLYNYLAFLIWWYFKEISVTACLEFLPFKINKIPQNTEVPGRSLPQDLAVPGQWAE